MLNYNSLKILSYHVPNNQSFVFSKKNIVLPFQRPIFVLRIITFPSIVSRSESRQTFQRLFINRSISVPIDRINSTNPCVVFTCFLSFSPAPLPTFGNKNTRKDGMIGSKENPADITSYYRTGYPRSGGWSGWGMVCRMPKKRRALGDCVRQLFTTSS